MRQITKTELKMNILFRSVSVELTAAGRWFILMNYFVHSVMYTYYMVVSTGLKLPKQLSMSVTALQTAQMLIGVMISVCVLFLKISGVVCQQSFDNLAMCFAIYASFLILFSKFFKTAYLVKKDKIANKSTVKVD
ncbi:GNS1/SUR4 family protein [Dictyocaulus viviparus]|uniref:Elongation of very long chain fatty acids protein n=1 Tax=Dictyocaulus viviparus TaxID=29172 RepID=A0A0D8XSB6_DICVI|nr:GNS1/SUR4 family protein [Dictyocaulus viviparus]